MLYEDYTIGGELMHSAKGVEWKNKKYINKVKTKTGKWRYIYKKTAGKVANKFTGKDSKNKLIKAQRREKDLGDMLKFQKERYKDLNDIYVKTMDPEVVKLLAKMGKSEDLRTVTEAIDYKEEKKAEPGGTYFDIDNPNMKQDFKKESNLDRRKEYVDHLKEEHENSKKSTEKAQKEYDSTLPGLIEKLKKKKKK